MSRRDKLGAVLSKQRPSSEGEASSFVVLATALKTGVRAHFWAIACPTGVDQVINAPDRLFIAHTREELHAIQLWLHTSLLPIHFGRYCQSKSILLQDPMQKFLSTYINIYINII